MEVDQVLHWADYEAFCKLIEQLPVPVLIIDEHQQVRAVNPVFSSQYSEGKACLSDWFSPFDLQRLEQYAQLQFLGTDPDDSPLVCQMRRHGEMYEVELVGQVLRRDSELFLALYFRQEVRESRVPRREKKRRQQLLNLLANPGTLIYIKDLEGRYRYVNPLFEQVFRVQNRQIRGKTDDDIFNGRIAEQFRQVDQKVFRTGESVRVKEVASQQDGLHTYISVKFPLHDRQGRVKGLVGISTDITEQLWAEDQVRAAQAVQTLLYPRKAPQYPGYDIAGLVSPAEVASGDYYDYIWLTPNRLVIAVGDVSGHGLGSALEMVETRSYLRAILRTEVRLDVAMECLNEFLYRDLRESTFVSLFLLELHLETGSFRYVGAGHQAEFLKADGTCQPLKSTGLILGIDSSVRYQLSPDYQLEDGDLLLILTDGVTEAMTPENEIYGRERVLELVRKLSDHPAQEVVESLIQTSRHVPLYESQSDDMTAVLVKYLG